MKPLAALAASGTFTVRWRRAAAAGALALAAGLLGACASDPGRIAPGTPRAEAQQALGQPTARYPLPGGGERWQYSYQPNGQRVVNIDLDAAGRVARRYEALTEANLARIAADQWTRDDVLREFGRPARVQGVHNFKGEIWVWRYADGPTWRLLFIDIDPQGTVRGWSAGDEPLPDADFDTR